MAVEKLREKGPSEGDLQKSWHYALPEVNSHVS